MKLAPTGVGAEPKKLAALGAILVAAGGIYWFETRSDSPTVSASVTPPQVLPAGQTAPRSATDAARTADPVIPVPQRRASSSNNQRSAGEDFRPTMKVKDDLDVSKVDPRIRLDLLAKVREAPMEGGVSSLFEFGKAPEPPAPKVGAINPGPVPVPVPAPAAKQTTTTKPPAGPPPPPPIPFKYYGYGKFPNGQLQGFFLEGDPLTGEISAAREGDTIKNRYKIVRIGIKSAVVEDTTTHNEQTLRLLDEAQ
jgi:hypothetical protein